MTVQTALNYKPCYIFVKQEPGNTRFVWKQAGARFHWRWHGMFTQKTRRAQLVSCTKKGSHFAYRFLPGKIADPHIPGDSD